MNKLCLNQILNLSFYEIRPWRSLALSGDKRCGVCVFAKELMGLPRLSSKELLLNIENKVVYEEKVQNSLHLPPLSLSISPLSPPSLSLMPLLIRHILFLLWKTLHFPIHFVSH